MNGNYKPDTTDIISPFEGICFLKELNKLHNYMPFIPTHMFTIATASPLSLQCVYKNIQALASYDIL